MARAADKVLKIGLVNNMPDPALVDTDRQFSSLVAESLEGAPFELVRLHLSSLERSPTARAWRDQRSRPAQTIERAQLDAVIITGAEPKTADLSDEVYWEDLTKLIDHALRLELRVLCSCLASHVAVQHLTGLKRRKRKEKLSGVFEFDVRKTHPLAHQLGPRLTTPHSRWNSLDAGDLERIGAEILSVSTEEVDAFALPQAPLWLCLQGHPEYEPDTLVREFRRDLFRFQNGQISVCPAPPQGVFALDEPAILHPDRAGQRVSALIDACDRRLSSPASTIGWRHSAVALYRAWLSPDRPYAPANSRSRPAAPQSSPRRVNSRRP